MTNIEMSGSLQSDSLFCENRIFCEWLSSAQAALYLGISENALRIMVYLNRWVPKSWSTKTIGQITTEEIYEMIQASSVRLGSISQKNILKMLRKIFQMAVEE